MKLLLSVLLLLFYRTSFARNQLTDSLRHELTRTTQDTSQVLLLSQLSSVYRMMNPDSALFYGNKALLMARQIHFIKGEVNALLALCFTFRDKGNLSKAMELCLMALQKARENHLPEETGRALHYIGLVYADLNDYPRALTYFRLGLTQFNLVHERIMISVSQMVIGQIYYRRNQLDSASHYINLAYVVSSQHKDQDFHSFVLFDLGDIQAKSGHIQAAFSYYRQSIQYAERLHNYRAISIPNYRIAELFRMANQRDSSIYYAQKALANAQEGPFNKEILDASTLLASLHDSVDALQAFQYFKIAALAKDSLYGPEKVKAVQNLLFDEQERQRKIEQAATAYQTQVRQYTLLAGLGVFMLIAFILYRTNQQKQKANNLLHQQKEEIDTQRTKAEQALTELKSTQAQLIQKEKMASLGELTAGIAHEIQNPLNFVNNFSEVSAELATELKDELQAEHKTQALDLADDLTQNLEKITLHGRRASAIVKGMLEHSRTSTGERQPTELNALAEEYLRLTYQGFRAKDKTFNTELTTDFDPNLGLVEVVPQDIGRVLLNLFNNAFYAVREKQKTTAGDYQPTVWVSTRRLPDSVEIRVRDNGMGIPDAVKDKIFQPFFTTKPTGEGTGLGLSLSYDMVTKGHGGTLTVESQENEGTEFTISLPGPTAFRG